SNPSFGGVADYLSPFNLVTYYLLPEVDHDRINALLEASHIVAPWIAWVFVSYGVGFIFEGEGSLRAIARSSAYCLVPYILFTLPIYLITGVLVQEERGWVNLAISVTYFWCILLFLLQVKVVHDFNLGKSSRVAVVNLVGMAAVVGFLGLLYLVTSQMFHVGWEVIYELRTL